MKAQIFSIVFVLSNFMSVEAQKIASTANFYYNSGLEFLHDGDFVSADSLFTLALNMYPDVDGYFNRALARKKLGNESGFCGDIFLATANGDSAARIIFLMKCTVADTIFLDSKDNIVDRNVSVKIKIIAKRKFDSNTDIIVIDSMGKEIWSNVINTTPLLPEDSIELFKTEYMPSFYGGEEGLVRYLAQNIKYPPKSIVNGDHGIVNVIFVIGREGFIDDVRILNGVSKELDDEALRVVSSMPQWFPGMQQGRFVEVKYTMPIKFTLR